MINLFEYQNKVPFPDDFPELELFLDEIWQNREKATSYFAQEDKQVESQRFIQFLHKSCELKSNKYVGVIHFQGQRINLLPKIFYDGNREYGEQEVQLMHLHVLWWLSYCRKIRFPNYQASLGQTKSDFFEVLIYLFAKYTRQLLSSSIYQQYEEVSKELNFVKGRLDTQRYINQSISKGRWHKLQCTYDAFVFDNRFNQIIKSVTTLLFRATTNTENKKWLREILFILDEVSDVPATAKECAAIQFNPMFGEFETVRDYCYLFLSNCISFDYKNELKLFAFLLPMEYVFEDFVFGFIEKEIEGVSPKSQVSSRYLDVDRNFQLRPDLLLEVGDRKILADTKYKLVYTDAYDPQKGLAQSDLYQMLAYAIRFKIDEIILFYPNTVFSNEKEAHELIIEDEFAAKHQIRVRAVQLPIIHMAAMEKDSLPKTNSQELFKQASDHLTNQIREVLKSDKSPPNQC